MPDTMQQPVERTWQKDWEMCEKATTGPWTFMQEGGWEEGRIIGPEGRIIMDFGSDPDEYVQVCGQRPTEEDTQFMTDAREALPYWLQEYQKKNECHIEVQNAYSGLLCEYHNFKETFRALARKSGATENRERTLLTAIKIAIDEYGQWQDKAAAAHIMFGALNEALNRVYGDGKNHESDG